MQEACILGGITERLDQKGSLSVSLELVKNRVLETFSRAYFDLALKFARGRRLRRIGRAPYFHVLRWLALSTEWSLQMDQCLIEHPQHKGSVGQIVDKDYLQDFILNNKDFSDVMHYDKNTRILGVEDPKFVYFIRNLDWRDFSKKVGFVSTEFETNYDFALSFSGTDRDVAESLAKKLTEYEIEVFYDRNEQHRILAEDVEEYLAPIYRSGALFIVVLLGKDYPIKIWTNFESKQFKDRFDQHSVIPIWFNDNPRSGFDKTSNIGGLVFDRAKNLDTQVDYFCSALINKLKDFRLSKVYNPTEVAATKSQDALF